MTTSYGPLGLVRVVAGILDGIDIPYVLGGSMASSLVGEPRSTVDVDMAVKLDAASGEELLQQLGEKFYVPHDSARQAIIEHSSFNALDIVNALKVDLFVLGDDLLDRMQIERRIRIAIGGEPKEIWVTSAEDQVLRKLDWYQRAGGVSERQWRDVVGILRVRRDSLDLDYLRTTATMVGIADALNDAIDEAADTDH